MFIKFKLTELDNKLLNMMLNFIALDSGRTSKIGLMKYLFYADFTFYRDFGRMISGAKWVALPNGPAPDMWEEYLNELVHKKLIKYVRVNFVKADGSYGHGDYYSLDKGAFDDELFEVDEIQRMNDVFEALKLYRTKQLSEMSHGEIAYIEAMEAGIGKELNPEDAYFISLLEDDVENDIEKDDEEVAANLKELEDIGIL